MTPIAIRTLILSSILILAVSTVLFSQGVLPERQVIATSGGSAVLAGKRLDFTIGEPVTATLTAPPAIVFTQGFQQPELPLISTATFPRSVGKSSIQVESFPNPVVESLNLRFTGDEETVVRLEAYLFSTSGQLMMPVLQLDNKTAGAIDCTALPSGQYLLYLNILEKHEAGVVLSFIKINR